MSQRPKSHANPIPRTGKSRTLPVLSKRVPMPRRHWASTHERHYRTSLPSRPRAWWPGKRDR
jgi:hypothetical protein